ncbi:MAG: Lipid 3-O-deacylase-related protein [Neobacillus sp.]|nr:Lipid 3-O-deacylase-related protein [Neobacillus sp.]
MPRLICLVIVIIFLLICLPGKSYCYAAASQLELEWDHLTPHGKNRNLDTVSLHILEKLSETRNKSIYRGITITRPHGDILWENQNKSSSAVGIGPVYMLRYGESHSGKLSMAFDIRY